MLEEDKKGDGGCVKRETEFQAQLKKKLTERFPGCFVMKTDPSQIQGVPDLIVLYKDKWATLECKRSKNSSIRPNQEYYVDEMNRLSFSRFIYPENEEEVLNDLERSFKS